ncbi:MAG: hypothetical protein IT290_03755 [Deltaproteobacteria bacterium]|nr:hypothetical protein [Deltaproteobacteria bacterium]
MSTSLLRPLFTATDTDALGERLRSSLARRIQESQSAHGASYTREEVEDISEVSTALFPKGLELSDKETEDFRALCSFSQVTLKPAREIRSHRKYIGKVIVAVKRATWPFIAFHMKDTMRGVQEFQIRTVLALAENLVERRELRKRADVD